MRSAIYNVCFLFSFSAYFACLDAGARKDDSSAHARLHASREAAGDGDLSAAVDHARRAVETDPAFADARKQYGRALMLSGQNREALDVLEKHDC